MRAADVERRRALAVQRERIVAGARGFIYMVSVAGVTGARSEIAAGLPAFVARVREHLRTQQTSSAARGLLELLASRKDSTAAPTTQYLTRLPIKTGDKVAVIKTADVDTIESAGNYVCVHAGKESYILRETLNALETQLDPETFLRVSRSAIINLDRVKELQPMFKGEHIIVLQNGKRLAMTRGLLREVEQALKFR